MKTFYDFLMMGGYALYVWSAYGVTFFLLAFQYWRSKKQASQIKNTLRITITENKIVEDSA